MRIVIAGGHGKIALILERLPRSGGIRWRGSSATRSTPPTSKQRVPSRSWPTWSRSRSTRSAHICVAPMPSSSLPGRVRAAEADRKDTVDRDAAILLADAAEAAGVRRFLMVSSTGADANAPEGDDPVFTTYLRAKGAADDNIRVRAALEWTIVRPGHLTDDPGTGTVEIADGTLRGSIPREDVAAVLLALLDAPGTAGQTLEVIGGEAPIGEAVAARE